MCEEKAVKVNDGLLEYHPTGGIANIYVPDATRVVILFRH